MWTFSKDSISTAGQPVDLMNRQRGENMDDFDVKDDLLGVWTVEGL
jgi:hypothetical protein